MRPSTGDARPFGIEYPTIPLLVTGLFSVYVLAWYLQASSRSDFLLSIRFELVLGIVLSLFLVTHLFNDHRGVGFLTPMTWTVVALYLVILVQLPLSADPEHSWTTFVERVLKFSFLGLFIVGFVKSPAHLRIFLVVFMLACFRLEFEGMVGQVTGSLVWQNQGIMRLHGPTDLYEHPNSFAGLALGSLPFVVYFIRVVPWPLKLLLAVQGVFAVSIVLLTGSRTGYVGFLAMLAFGVHASAARGKTLVGLVLLALVLAPLIPAEYVGRFESIFTGQEAEGASRAARIEILRDAWAILADHPFGVGVAAFPAVRLERFGRTQDTHNLYLEVATNLGFQGLIVFLVFVWGLLRTLRRTERSVRDQADRLKGSPATAHLRDLDHVRRACQAVQMFLVIRLCLGMFGMDLYEIYWWFSLGLAVAMYKMNETMKRRTATLLGAEPIEPGPRSARVPAKATA
jgi:O-antigen ligase